RETRHTSLITRHALVVGLVEAQQVLAEAVLDGGAVPVTDRHRIALGSHFRREKNGALGLVERRQPGIELLQVVDGAAAGKARSFRDTGEIDATAGMGRLHAGFAVELV